MNHLMKWERKKKKTQAAVKLNAWDLEHGSCIKFKI